MAPVARMNEISTKTVFLIHDYGRSSQSKLCYDVGMVVMNFEWSDGEELSGVEEMMLE